MPHDARGTNGRPLAAGAGQAERPRPAVRRGRPGDGASHADGGPARIPLRPRGGGRCAAGGHVARGRPRPLDPPDRRLDHEGPRALPPADRRRPRKARPRGVRPDGAPDRQGGPREDDAGHGAAADGAPAKAPDARGGARGSQARRGESGRRAAKKARGQRAALPPRPHRPEPVEPRPLGAELGHPKDHPPQPQALRPRARPAHPRGRLFQRPRQAAQQMARDPGDRRIRVDAGVGHPRGGDGADPREAAVRGRASGHF